MKTEITRRWSLGESMRQIAKALGVTRNVVAGHMSRMRANGQELEHRSSGGNHYSRPKKPKTDQQITPRLYALQQPRKKVAQPAPPTDTAVTIIDLEPWHCKAVMDGRRDNLPLYCGRPRLEGSSYCGEHFDKYFGGRLR